MATITAEQFHAYINEVETTPRDASEAIAVGDYVVLNPEHRGEAWMAGHVERVNGEHLYIAFGGREQHSMYWLRGDASPEPASQVLELWRRHRIVERTYVAGICATGIGFEWLRVW